MKRLVAVIGGSAVVTMGVLAFTLSQPAEQTQVAGAGEMSMGATSTQVTPATTPEVAVAKPAIHAGSS